MYFSLKGENFFITLRNICFPGLRVFSHCIVVCVVNFEIREKKSHITTFCGKASFFKTCIRRFLHHTLQMHKLQFSQEQLSQKWQVIKVLS